MTRHLLVLTTLSVTLACSSPPKEQRGPAKVDTDTDTDTDIVDVTLVWDTFETEKTTFNVYASLAPYNTESDHMLVASDVTVDDPTAPSITLSSDVNTDLKPFIDKSVCLWIAAVIADVESEPSTQDCLEL